MSISVFHNRCTVRMMRRLFLLVSSAEVVLRTHNDFKPKKKGGRLRSRPKELEFPEW